ncbi:MAG: hypothetical protein PHY83_03165, partial [Bacilli bacterium]|nr:hypothetical protein [Bacilli bacterium]
TIFEMPEAEYDRFIAFLHSFNPKMQGNDALMLLLEVYDRYKVSDKLIAKLEQEIVELTKQVEDKQEDEKPKKKWIGSE